MKISGNVSLVIANTDDWKFMPVAREKTEWKTREGENKSEIRPGTNEGGGGANNNSTLTKGGSGGGGGGGGGDDN